MRAAFKHIAVFARGRSQGVTETLSALVQYLVERGFAVCVENETVELLRATFDLPQVQSEELSHYCDLLIVVGGDGSLIKAAHLAAPQGLPVLGINRGRIGFLTDIHPYAFEALEQVLAGEYAEEKRLMLANELHHNGDLIHSDWVVNETALSRGMVTHMIEFQVLINHEFVCRYRADGLIAASPTGSTAYALSGGGPILHPKLDTMVIVPMFSHTLTSRPIVIPGDSIVDVVVDETNETAPCVSCDGQDRVCITPGGRVRIRKAQAMLRLIHPKDYNYFETLRTKLHWESAKARGGS